MNKKLFLLLIFLIPLGIFLGTIVKAQDCATDCTKCTTELVCNTSPARCEWDTTKNQCCRKPETTWPTSPLGTQLTSCAVLTDMVRYFYEWGIFLGGLAVFISLLIGGFLYLTSAGDPGRMREAKDRIFSALIGLVLLFAIYLILNTINPDLTRFAITPLIAKCTSNADCLKFSDKFVCVGKVCVLGAEKVEGECDTVDDCASAVEYECVGGNPDTEVKEGKCEKICIKVSLNEGEEDEFVRYHPATVNNCYNVTVDKIPPQIKQIEMVGSCVLYLYRDNDSCAMEKLTLTIYRSTSNLSDEYSLGAGNDKFQSIRIKKGSGF